MREASLRATVFVLVGAVLVGGLVFCGSKGWLKGKPKYQNIVVIDCWTTAAGYKIGPQVYVRLDNGAVFRVVNSLVVEGSAYDVYYAGNGKYLLDAPRGNQ